MSTSETGHAKNVANLESLISFCTGYGPSYSPTKPSIKLAALNTLFTTAKTSLTTINTLLPPLTNAINNREIVFAPLSKLVTRVINALAASDVPQQTIDDAKTLARKIQGRRTSKKLPPVPDDPNTPEDESQHSISASQMSFDNRIDNTDKLIQLLAAQPGYNPSETDLKIITLNTLLASMKIKNTAVITALTPLSNARITRNNLLYTTGTGLVNVAADVKTYIKSVYGATSPQYKQVSTLKFTQYKP